MNASERDSLQAFLRRVTQSRPLAKDPLADHMIQEALAHHPDALYLLVQQAMASEIALAAVHKHAPQSPATPQVANNSATAERSPSLWSSGLLQTAGAITLGVTAGTLLADGLDDFFSDLG